MSIDKPDTRFRVLVNAERQYSIWPDFRAIPVGWQVIGEGGDQAQCLAWIEEHWTDMRPGSLQDALER